MIPATNGSKPTSVPNIIIKSDSKTATLGIRKLLPERLKKMRMTFINHDSFDNIKQNIGSSRILARTCFLAAGISAAAWMAAGASILIPAAAATPLGWAVAGALALGIMVLLCRHIAMKSIGIETDTIEQLLKGLGRTVLCVVSSGIGVIIALCTTFGSFSKERFMQRIAPNSINFLTDKPLPLAQNVADDELARRDQSALILFKGDYVLIKENENGEKFLIIEHTEPTK